MQLWIPGPTYVRPEILAEMSRPMIGHRGKAMDELHERIDPHLRLAFGLSPESPTKVAVHTCSGTGLMEMAVQGAGERILCVVNGAFSERFARVAESIGRQVQRLTIPWGLGATPEELERALGDHGPFDAVTVVSNETSTGARTPLGPLARVLEAYPRTLFLVDVVSYIGGAPVDFDANRMDFALAGVQKALALPPGIAVFAASERYLASAARQPRRGFYLDPIRILEGHVQRATPATPSIPHYYALARQLEDITAGVTLPAAPGGTPAPIPGPATWRARFAKHERMRERTLAWAAAHGITPFPAEPFRSPTVSCLSAPQLDIAAFVTALKSMGHEISNGYGDLKNKTFRIGHMGDHTEQALEELLAAADQAQRG